jgi:hypothetical protein
MGDRVFIDHDGLPQLVRSLVDSRDAKPMPRASHQTLNRIDRIHGV